MWPFRGQPESDYVLNVTDGAAPFRAFRDIGDTFNYLGRECIVTSHGRLVRVGLCIAVVPELRADYCDNEGVIRHITFALHELPGLIKQNGGVK